MPEPVLPKYLVLHILETYFDCTIYAERAGYIPVTRGPLQLTVIPVDDDAVPVLTLRLAVTIGLGIDWGDFQEKLGRHL